MTFVATLTALSGRLLVSGTLLIIAGAAGLAIVWDRWSLRSGDQVHFSAFLSPAQLTSDDYYMLVTHAPLLVIGLLFIYFSRPRQRQVAECSAVRATPVDEVDLLGINVIIEERP